LDSEFSVFITAANLSTNSMRVVIKPDINADPNCVMCDTPPIEFNMPNKDGTATDDELVDLHSAMDADSVGNIVFQRRHRVGLHLKCRSPSDKLSPSAAYLLLQISYQVEKNDPVEGRIKLFILPRSEK